jgi:hypothetical protein
MSINLFQHLVINIPALIDLICYVSIEATILVFFVSISWTFLQQSTSTMGDYLQIWHEGSIVSKQFSINVDISANSNISITGRSKFLYYFIQMIYKHRQVNIRHDVNYISLIILILI